MYINSPGGSITSLFTIYDTMKYIKPDISTVCMGLAASAASVILAGGTPGKRYSLPNARIMLHQPSGGMEGTVADMERNFDLIVSMRTQLNGLLADFTGQNVEKVAKRFLAKNVRFFHRKLKILAFRWRKRVFCRKTTKKSTKT